MTLGKPGQGHGPQQPSQASQQPPQHPSQSQVPHDPTSKGYPISASSHSSSATSSSAFGNSAVQGQQQQQPPQQQQHAPFTTIGESLVNFIAM